ncbi:hypothetical protein TRFO_15317 [Tritrichomonas foetus]|uniref:Regulator of chromosome condensation n=1 Tax=Tritrichomonas foetus TaxID=1144522 RepID=A0A1J4KXE9_9EUKA|nr:hypothetical protein TRFO_15317 [Tritrichomonas foetus]|eukprot:OHT14382.1 hypothetical protein TRFO_15317 [Tritrichomonas foetus]
MAIFISGQNAHSQLMVPSNTENENKTPCVCPPVQIPNLNWTDMKTFSIGQDHTVFVTSDGIAHCAGSDEKYQIGTKSRQIYKEVSEVSLEGYESYKFKSAFCGKHYTLYLTESPTEEILICCNKCRDFKPIRITLNANPTNIKMIKAGKTRIGFLDENDNLYIVEKKEIDLDDDVHDLKARKIEHPVSNGVKDFCIGETFICILSNDGKVFGNEELNKNRKNFTQVAISPKPIKFVKVFGTHFHCIILGENGSTFVFSYNGGGQLGLGDKEDTNKFVEQPFFLENKVKIVDVASSGFHTLFLSQDGRVFSCGNNFNGQLMHSECYEDERNLIPEAITHEGITHGKVKSMYCGEFASALFIE